MAEKNVQNDFSKGNIPAVVMRMALPLIAAQLVNVLYNVVDHIYIGHIPNVGSMALTGVGIALPVISILSAFAGLFGQGGAPLCSMARGRGDNDEASRVMGNAFSMLLRNTLLYNIVFIILGIVIPVALAVMINELYSKRKSKVYQTMMFFPHFLSWVVVSYFVFAFLNVNYGLLNKLAEAERFEDAAWALAEPVRTFSRMAVDDVQDEHMGKALEQIEDILGEGARFHDGDVFGPGFPGQGLGGVDADTVVGEEQVADTHDKHFVHTILGTGVAPAGGGMWCPPCPVPHGRRPCRRGCPGRDGSRTGDSIAARRGSRKGMTGKGGDARRMEHPPGRAMLPGRAPERRYEKGRGHPRPFGLCGLRTA